MRLEVHSAADFLMNLLRVKQAKNSLPENQLQKFKGSLQSLLVLRFRSHWYPEVPTKGSGYRCIRINGKMDPIVEEAGKEVGLPPRTLRKMLPTELTLWIDPEEVSYRIGENGSICVLFDSQSRASPSSDIDSTGSGAMSGGEEFIMERVGKMDIADMQMMDFLDSKNHNLSNSSSSSSGSSGSSSHMNNNGGGINRRTPGKQQQRLNNSLGSDEQLSPPLSPPYHHQQQHHQQQHNGRGSLRPQHLFGNTNGYARGSPHQQHFMDSSAHQYFHWDGGFAGNNNNNHHHHNNSSSSSSSTINSNKVRTQC